jgi:hypothetical protein
MKYKNLNVKYNISNFILEIKHAIRGPFYYDNEFLTLSKGSKIFSVKKKDWYNFKSNDILLGNQLLRVFTSVKSNLWKKHIK